MFGVERDGDRKRTDRLYGYLFDTYTGRMMNGLRNFVV